MTEIKDLALKYRDKFLELKDNMRIEIDFCGIVLNLTGDGGGCIVSDLKEVCHFCGYSDCEYNCDESQAYFRSCNNYSSIEQQSKEDVEDVEDVSGRLKFNIMMDALESIILAHAIAGIDVNSFAYIEGIKTAAQACGNQLY